MTATLLALLLAMLVGCGSDPDVETPSPTVGSPAQVSSQKKERVLIYDSEADMGAEIETALAKASKENQRVLLMWGGNSCGWCYKLHDLFEEDPTVSKMVRDHYIVKHVDLGSNAELKEKYTDGIASIPYLTVLSATGTVMTNQRTESLEEGNHHSPSKVLEFLEEWKPQPQVAEEVYRTALEKAGEENKLVFLHLGSPSCGYCRLLDAFLWREEIASLLDPDYVETKIDVARMEGGQDLAQRLRPEGSGGIPWFAVLNPQGEILATSDGENGNVGYPVAANEIGHFLEVLRGTAHHLTPEHLSSIEKALIEEAEKLKARRTAATG